MFTDDFTTGINPAWWTVRSNQTLFTIEATQGEVRISKPLGGADVLRQTGLAFWGELLGDFDAQVEFRDAQLDRQGGSGNNELQLWVKMGGQDIVLVLGDEWFGRMIHVFRSPECANLSIQPCTATSGVLRMARAGQQIYCYLDDMLVYQGSCGSEPAKVWFDLQNNGSHDAIAATFDNFCVAAGQIRRPGPQMLRQPASQLSFWGKDVVFAAGVAGPPQRFAQWFKDGVPIVGATNASLAWTDFEFSISCGDFIASQADIVSLMLTNLQMADAGSYTVVITNSSGSVTSAPAILTVNPAGVDIALYAGVTIAGVVGKAYGIQTTTDLSNPNSWRGVTNLTLTASPYLWHESQPATRPGCYYRVVPGPISIP